MTIPPAPTSLVDARHAFYLWIKTNEKKVMPHKHISNNAAIFTSHVCESQDLQPLVDAYPSLREMWEEIPWWIVKADIGRLLLVYFYGHFYFDIDCSVKKCFFDRIDPNAKCLLFVEKVVPDVSYLGPRACKDEKHKVRIANYAFGAGCLRHPFIKEVIDEAIRRTKLIIQEGLATLKDADILWCSGPDVITSVYHKSKYNDVQLLPNSTSHDVIEHYLMGSWRAGNSWLGSILRNGIFRRLLRYR